MGSHRGKFCAPGQAGASCNGWNLPEAVTSARLLGIVVGIGKPVFAPNPEFSCLLRTPWSPPRRPPYFFSDRRGRLGCHGWPPRGSSRSSLTRTVVHPLDGIAERLVAGGRSSAPPGSLGPSPWGRASGSLQGRVRPCSCSPPLVTSSSILRVTARSPCGDRSGLARTEDTVRTSVQHPRSLVKSTAG